MTQAQYTPSEAVDFVVVGTGAAGGVMVKELAAAGFRVVALEQGPYFREKDFQHDEIGHIFLHALTNDPNLQPTTFRKTATEQARRQWAVLYGRQVGGGSVHFTANYWRFHEADFIERSRWGSIVGTGLDDWPITYAELEPYYTKAEEEIGVSGQAGANPFEPWRSKPYPLPPLPVKSSGVIFERAAKKLGLHPYPAPLAILSRAYRGRAACVHCGYCMQFGCEVGAKSSTLAALIPLAEQTGRCEIRPHSYARKIELGRDGRVTGVIYYDARRREVFQRAKAVVVCANGAETPRLLLMSTSNRFPQGLANSSGLVGKYLMFDAGALCAGLFEHPLNEYKSVQVSRLVQDFYDADPRRGFYGGGGIDARFQYYPVTFALEGMPPDAPRWGPEFKAMLGELFPRTMTVLSHSTCLPLQQNSISLDPELKDSWGLPVLRVTFKNHPDDLKIMQFLLERQMEILEAAGARKRWAFPIEEVTFSAHLMGTCRMGNDPSRSVVDPHHRAHDVPNLFLVDGSSLVTSGRQQPTCTIQALAYRAADHITRLAQSGRI